jgi:hypothetical protein
MSTRGPWGQCSECMRKLRATLRQGALVAPRHGYTGRLTMSAPADRWSVRAGSSCPGSGRPMLSEAATVHNLEPLA